MGIWSWRRESGVESCFCKGVFFLDGVRTTRIGVGSISGSSGDPSFRG